MNTLAMIEGDGEYAVFIEHVNALEERQKGGDIEDTDDEGGRRRINL